MGVRSAAPVHVTVWDDGGRGDGAVPAVFVHSIFTWGTDETYGFAGQRPLAGERRLLLLDRRGYGDSPDCDGRSDFEVDAADVAGLLGDGAHLVGHGNGAVAALLAAARCPSLVRSLALVQPSAFTAAASHPVVADLLRRVRGGVPGLPEGMTPEEYLRASTAGMGLQVPEATERRLRAVATSMGERPVWEAELSPAPLAGVPVLVVCGTWEGAPAAYREHVGAPLVAVAETLARTMRARLLRVPGYYPHTQQPAAVNAALRELWAAA